MSPLRTALFTLVVALGLTVLMLWFFRGDQLRSDAARVLGQSLQSVQRVQAGAQSALPATGLGGTSPTATGTLPPAAGVHKCLDKGRVVYTDEPCATDSKEQALRAGSVTVVPATRHEEARPAPPASHAAEVDLMEKRIEAVVNH